MQIPDNTLPMMTGSGPYGGVEMGGMFSVLKVRRDQKPGDYANPGWYQQPPGTQAFEWTGALPDPARFKSESQGSMPLAETPVRTTQVQVRKPSGHAGH
jgi:hypothetical protein